MDKQSYEGSIHLNLVDALRLDRSTRAAVVGAGGKTTLLRLRAQAFSPPVFVTNTAHIGLDQLGFAGLHLVVDHPATLESLAQGLPEKIVAVTGRPDFQKRRFSGLDPEVLGCLRQLADANRVPMIVEADGSRRLAIKAPAAHEPPIPGFSQAVIVLAGLSVLNAPLSSEWVYNPDGFASLSGLTLGAALSAEALGRVLIDPLGGLKNIPVGARRILILNQAEEGSTRQIAETLARSLLPAYHAVVVAALHPSGEQGPQLYSIWERTAGIVLAAGQARRMGQPKQLLAWRGQPLVRHVAGLALQAGLDPVYVVTGSHAAEVSAALAGLSVEQVYNPDWETGQASSVRAAVESLPPDVGSAIFLLCDQPQIPARLVQALADRHAHSLAPIVAPRVNGRRANPVLFDRRLFPEMITLDGDSGGRQLFERYSPEWLAWKDETILLDVDTPEDYHRLVNLSPAED